MRNRYLSTLLLSVGLIAVFQSCRNDEYLANPPAVTDQSFVEEFDTVSSALARGWQIINASDPKGSSIWQQGGAVTPIFSPFSSSGTYAGFIGVDYLSTSSATGVVSNWLISPEVTMQNGDTIVFYTRSALEAASATDSTDYGNRLQVAINTLGSNLSVGSGLDRGNFQTVLLDINPTYIEHRTNAATYSPLAYPARWTRFEATIYGLNGPTKGRFGFRFFIEDPAANGLAIGIDQVSYKSINHK